MASAPSCCGCEKNVGETTLKCQSHKLCAACLDARVLKEDPSKYRDCLICRTASFAVTSGMIWIYVDDSNIWIEAKKLASKMKGYKTGEDHRIRIDIGRLTDVVANERPSQGFLYGSEPPPIDTVWEKIKEKGWEVDKFRRQRGKEKQVDAQLVADVTARAIETPMPERTTICLVSGDADVLPAIRHVLAKEGWKVEVHMWKHAISKELQEYASQRRNRIQIKYLDDQIANVTFTNMKFNYSDRGLHPMAKENGLVFTMKPNAFRIDYVSWKMWCNEVENIAQWPFQYYWFKKNGKETGHLLMVFKADREKGKFDLADFLRSICPEHATTESSSHPIRHVLQIETYLSFSQTDSRTDWSFSSAGQFSLQYMPEEGTSDDQFELVRSDSHYAKKKQRYSQPCKFRFNCKFGKNCHDKHTDGEKEFFRNNQGRGNPLRKAKICQYYKEGRKCFNGILKCNYAHGERDAWCLVCAVQGHLTDNCPNFKKK